MRKDKVPRVVKTAFRMNGDFPKRRHRRKDELVLIGMVLPLRKMCMNLKSRIEDSDDTHQNHQTSGKKIHDEFQWICEMKGADQVLNAEEEKKERQKSDQNHFPPPEA
jgi:hypothetical protein